MDCSGLYRKFHHEGIDDGPDYRDEVESVPRVFKVALKNN